MPVLAKGRSKTGLWTVVRDDRPFGGADQPTYFYSPDRSWLAACASENLHPNFVIS